MSQVRCLSEKSARILHLIAQGHSYSQIVDGNADVTFPDIFLAAEEALKLGSSSEKHSRRLAQVRVRFPRAYEPWTSGEDAELRALHASGKTSNELAVHFQRQPSAIHSRLAKLGLERGARQEA